MKVRPLPGVTGAHVRKVLDAAAMAFANVQGGNTQAIDIYNAYLRAASEQVRTLSSVLPAADLDRLMTTPRYWMLHSIDPAGKLPTLASLMSLELQEKIQLLSQAVKTLDDEVYAYSHADLIIVPDTNYLLHHPQRVESIDWTSVVPGRVDHVIVAIPILVIDELDKSKRRTEKIENGSESVRTRARHTVSTLEDWFRGRTAYTVPDSKPIIEFLLALDDQTRPRLPDADYEIIDNAHAIADVSDAKVIIASFDAGMRLRARAAGVDAVEPATTSSVTA